jgi:metallophosphoesterase (TIGR00282 family)
MNILFLGDVTGRTGRKAVLRRLPSLKKETAADFTIINGENAAHGKGITSGIYHELMDAGADVITLGNHMFSKHEITEHMDECPYLVRPGNLFPPEPGSCIVTRTCLGKRIAVISLCGSIFMDGVMESPFVTMDKILAETEADVIVVDFHAEATSEKELFFHVYRNRVTAVIGTHTHVQTADEMVLDGCAYISDAGMCGPMESIIGRDIEEVKARMIHGEKTRYVPSKNPAMICGVLISLDESGRARSIRRIQERP